VQVIFVGRADKRNASQIQKTVKPTPTLNVKFIKQKLIPRLPQTPFQRVLAPIKASRLKDGKLVADYGVTLATSH